MDLFNIRAIEVTKLAMDGLQKRQTAIASNTANAMTPDYQRKQVAFEDQLRESLAYQKDPYKAGYTTNPNTTNIAQRLPQEQFMYIQQTRTDTDNYAPEVIKDTRWIDYGNGNNVNVEEEMMTMAKTGSQYNVLATIEGRFMSNLLDVVRGGGS